MRTSRWVSGIALTLVCLLSCWSGAITQAAIAPATLSPPSEGRPALSGGPIVVYINWDGFAKYYIDLAEAQGKIPTLSRIRYTDGVFFENAYTGIPSITNPMQAAIASGTTPRYTDNHYRYYDKKLNRVIQEQPARKNEAETLAEAAARQGVNVLSINQFAFLTMGLMEGEQARIYINAPVGANGYSDHAARFDEAIWLIKNNYGGLFSEQSPLLIALYMDDLDALGHNMGYNFGQAPVRTEAERRQAVIGRLAEMDAKLGEFIQVCREAGLYDRMSFLLTADHGMVPMGLQQSQFDDSIRSKLPDLLWRIEALGPGFKCEVLSPGGKERPKPESKIAVVTVGLQVQLSYIGEYNADVIAAKNFKITAALQGTSYIGRIMYPWEMMARGVKLGFADLLISPQPPFHFRISSGGVTRARGQHDSLAEEAQRIGTFMWGNAIKKGITAQGRVYNEDFTPTITRLLGINAPLDATGRVLYEVLEAIAPPQERLIKIEDQAAVTSGKVHRYQDGEASGGTAVNLRGKYTALELNGVPAASGILVRYAAASDSKLLLYINDHFLRSVFFPASEGLAFKYDTKKMNFTLNQGDTVRFVTESTDPEGINIDCIIFTQEEETNN